MKIRGEHPLDFPRDAVWQALMDPEVLARTLPGCKSLERTAEDTFAGKLLVAIGPVRGTFKGTLALSEIAAPDSYRMTLDGAGPSGFLRGEGTVRLAADGERTLLHYDVDAQVGGKIAGVGQRLLDSSARAIAQQGLEGLERQLRALHGAAETEETGAEATAERGTPGDGRSGAASAPAGAGSPAAAPGSAPASAAEGARARTASRPAAEPTKAYAEPPSQARFAAAVAKDVLADLVPPPHRPWVIGCAAFLAGLLLGFAMGRSSR